jgi:ATP-dependent NAD(P)H-hydrate dehydratase
MSNRLNNVIICKKGIVDLVSDGRYAYVISVEGSLKRCGGQGDLLSGMLGTFSKYGRNLTDVEDENERAVLAVVAASVATR